MRRTILCLVALALPGLAGAADPPAKPNIVIILADDQGWGDLSINGNTNLRTPHIDGLARDGARFERFFGESPLLDDMLEALAALWPADKP